MVLSVIKKPIILQIVKDTLNFEGHLNCFIGSKVRGEFYLVVELHREGSAPAACAAGLYYIHPSSHPSIHPSIHPGLYYISSPALYVFIHWQLGHLKRSSFDKTFCLSFIMSQVSGLSFYIVHHLVQLRKSSVGKSSYIPVDYRKSIMPNRFVSFCSLLIVKTYFFLKHFLFQYQRFSKKIYGNSK